MTLKISPLFSFIALLFSIALPAHGQNGIYTRLDLVASSEPVPIADMISGWDGDYRSGEVVFADAAITAGFTFPNGYLQREQRHYYYLKFNRQTSDFYRALELKQDLTEDKKLDLKISQFEALGAAVGGRLPEFEWAGAVFSMAGKFALYQVGHFQFAELDGVAEAGDVTAASGLISYRYDDDKLLDHEAQVDKGLGMSISAELNVHYQQWSSSITISDLFNQFQWQNAAFTTGCINIGGGNQARCEAQGVGSGVSGQGKIIESIPYTITGQVTQTAYDVSLLGMRHDTYFRLGLEKGIDTSLGRLGFFLYYPRLIGASWQTEYFDVQLGADTLQLSKARNIQLNMGIKWHW